MSARVRPARTDDLEPLYELAKLTGGGFTNLPADRDALAARLARSEAAFADGADGGSFLLMLDDLASGRIAGTAQIIARTGIDGPFYSYRRTTRTQHSQPLGRTIRAEMLALTNDLEGCSEVGGLFLHPRFRAGGLGLLLARSRYLFIRLHRERFAAKLLAELRGVIDEGGGSPFWDGVAGRFLGLSFQQADAFNAVHGTAHLSSLMPHHPVYLAMLPEAARNVIGVPHATGRAAMRMLEAEGFAEEGYLDIFDGGPTLSVATDRMRTALEAAEGRFAGAGAGGTPALVATGTLRGFRCGLGRVEAAGAEVRVEAATVAALALEPGDTVLHVAR